MVDTGKYEDFSYLKVEDYLKRNNITELEWILLSHFHDDHYGGLERLIYDPDINIKTIYTKIYHGYDSKCNTTETTVENFRIERLNHWNNFIANIESKNITIEYITEEKNNEISLGNYHFKLLNLGEVFESYVDICEQFKSCNENTNTVIAVGKNNNRYYYLNGDIDTYPSGFSTSDNQTLKNAYLNNRVDKWVEKGLNLYNITHFDVYKIAHHGVYYNNIEESFIAAKPGVCISCGVKRSSSVLENRVKKGNPNAKIYYTAYGIVSVSQDDNGNIKVIQGPDEHKKLNYTIPISTETHDAWIYNPKLNKCLFTGNKYAYRPVIKDCDNSTSDQWEIPISGNGYYKSKKNGWCLWIKEDGTVLMKECEKNSIIKDINISNNKHSISPFIYQGKCLGLFTDIENGKLNMNNCDETMVDQYWEVWDRNPYDIIKAKTQTVYIYNPKLDKCLFSGKELTYRPTIRNCFDNSKLNLWEIPVSGDGFYKSKNNKWCLWISENNSDIIMKDCDNKAIIKDIKTSSNKHSISFTVNTNKCLGLLSDLKNSKLSMNECDRKKNDQYWEIKKAFPNDNNKKQFMFIIQN